MIIKGWQPASLVDFPGKIASTIFLAGCNMRCGYCHNPDLVLNSPTGDALDPDVVLDHLEFRSRFIDGLCVSGGEPLLHKELPRLLERVKAAKSLIKVDTNGTCPDALETLIDRGLVNYVAMDIKGPPEKIPVIARCDVALSEIEESIDILRASSIDYEFRTTVVPGFLEADDIMRIFQWLAGAPRYYLQQFRPIGLLDPSWESLEPYPPQFLRDLAEKGREFFEICEVRGV